MKIADINPYRLGHSSTHGPLVTFTVHVEHLNPCQGLPSDP
jgi:hypothetical protein